MPWGFTGIVVSVEAGADPKGRTVTAADAKKVGLWRAT
jgi:hypothetical protein